MRAADESDVGAPSALDEGKEDNEIAAVTFLRLILLLEIPSFGLPSPERVVESRRAMASVRPTLRG